MRFRSLFPVRNTTWSIRPKQKFENDPVFETLVSPFNREDFLYDIRVNINAEVSENFGQIRLLSKWGISDYVSYLHIYCDNDSDLMTLKLLGLAGPTTRNDYRAKRKRLATKWAKTGDKPELTDRDLLHYLSNKHDINLRSAKRSLIKLLQGDVEEVRANEVRKNR